jgi:hypothetical protein
VINAPGGIDLVDTLRTAAFVKQQEAIFCRGIQPSFILRAELCDKKGNIIKVFHAEDFTAPDQTDAMGGLSRGN